ncbi:MAG: PIN domain-containing protein [Candidatus Hadarchaeia archaeon]
MGDYWLVLDTNILMTPERWGVDIFKEFERLVDKEYKLIVPEAVIKELEDLKEIGETKEKKAAKIGLELASKAKEIPSKKPADEKILRLSEKRKCIVATNDKELKKALRERGVPVIYLRQTTHLNITGKL